MDGGSGASTAKDARSNRWLASVERRLAKAAQEGHLSALLWRLCRRLTLFLTMAYLTSLVLLWLATRCVGERNITTAFVLYLPPAIWLLPVVPLAALSLLFHWRCLIALVAGSALLAWGWMGYGLNSTRSWFGDPDPNALTVMTYNRGQHMNQSLQPFKNAAKPDVLVLQEAAGRAQGFLNAPEYREFIDAKSVGEFTLLSRFPITESAWVAPLDGRRPRAARFVIDWKGKAVSVYAVHLQTPREVLTSYRRGAFLWGLIGWPGTPWVAKRNYYQAYWNGQIDDARTVLDAVRVDPNPSLVAGDFNAPHTGYIHRMITRELEDAHEEAGGGFGFTFPGATHNPLSAGGPWLRIDYVFFTRSWRAVSCLTELQRASQHRAVAAKLVLER